jgi:hypothetical protein
VCVCVCVCVCVRACVRACVFVCVCVHVYVSVRAHVRECVLAWESMCACVCVQRAIALSLEADGMGVAVSNSDDRPKSPLKRSAFGSGEGSNVAWGAARQSTLEAGQAVIHTDASGAERPAVVLHVRPAGQLRFPHR